MLLFTNGQVEMSKCSPAATIEPGALSSSVISGKALAVRMIVLKDKTTYGFDIRCEKAVGTEATFVFLKLSTRENFSLWLSNHMHSLLLFIE